MQQHTVLGDEIATECGFSEEIIRCIRGHHERLDGTGYPDGKSGRVSSARNDLNSTQHEK